MVDSAPQHPDCTQKLIINRVEDILHVAVPVHSSSSSPHTTCHLEYFSTRVARQWPSVAKIRVPMYFVFSRTTPCLIKVNVVNPRSLNLPEGGNGTDKKEFVHEVLFFLATTGILWHKANILRQLLAQMIRPRDCLRLLEIAGECWHLQENVSSW